MSKRGQRLLNVCVWLLGVQLCAVVLPLQAIAASPIVTELPDAIGYHTDHAVVPLTPMLEILGATLTESAAGGEFFITRQKKTFSFAAGSLVAHANGKEVTFPLAPIRVADQFFLPLQPLVTALGGRVRWKHDKHETVFITTLPGVKQPFKLLFFGFKASKQDDAGNTVTPSVQELLELCYNTQPQLFVMQSDGSGVRQLTFNMIGTTLPSFSADGTRYVAMRTMDQSPYGAFMNTRISTSPQSEWMGIQFDRKDITVVKGKDDVEFKGEFSFFVISPMLSPDGKTIIHSSAAVSLEEKRQYPLISRLPFQGGKSQKLAYGISPCWSPDGRTIAYAAPDAEGKNSVIHLISADGRSTQTIGAGEEPVFSPDGCSLLFYRYYREGGKASRMVTNCRLGTRPGDCAVIESSVDQRDHYEMDAVFTPDSKQILFARNGGISLMTSDLRERKQLTNGQEDRHPVCSADGSQVYFLRDGQIYRMKMDGSELTPITKDLRVSDFCLSADGASIYFTHQPREMPE